MFPKIGGISSLDGQGFQLLEDAKPALQQQRDASSRRVAVLLPFGDVSPCIVVTACYILSSHSIYILLWGDSCGHSRT